MREYNDEPAHSSTEEQIDRVALPLGQCVSIVPDSVKEKFVGMSICD